MGGRDRGSDVFLISFGGYFRSLRRTTNASKDGGKREPRRGTQVGMRGRTAYVTHADCSRHDTGWRHPEHQGRLPAVARAVHRDMLTLFERLLEVEGRPASVDELRLAHTHDYIERVRAKSEEAARLGSVLPLEGDVVVSGASWEAVLAAVGCVRTAVLAVLAGEATNAFCAVRPPGHGASAASPGAYGIFNSTAIAARWLARGVPPRRTLVVEVGSRAGTGTAEILGGEERVRFLSLHAEGSGEPLADGTGRVIRRLPAGSGGTEMLRALQSGLEEVEAGFAPELMLFSLGCDALAGDPLGMLGLEADDYYALTVELRERAERICQGRLVSVLEEGYQPEAMGRAVVQHLRALAALPPREE